MRVDGLGFRPQDGVPQPRDLQDRHAGGIILRRVDHGDVPLLPVCGGALDSRSLKAGDPDRLVCTQCGFVFYLDPKVAVGTIIDDGHGRILLVRRAIEPGYGKWVFPGGYVDRGEQVLAAAIREAREECGLARRAPEPRGHLLVRGPDADHHRLRRDPHWRRAALDDEGLEARWFAADEVPWDDLAFKSTYEGIRDYLAGRRYPLKAEA